MKACFRSRLCLFVINIMYSARMRSTIERSSGQTRCNELHVRALMTIDINHTDVPVDSTSFTK